MKLRLLRFTDISTVGSIVEENYNKKYRKLAEEEMQQMFLSNIMKPTFIVAEFEGCIIGFAAFMQAPMDYHVYNIFWVNVTSVWQRRGVGKAMVANILERIKKKRSAYVVQLTTSSPRYYSRHFGFKTALVFGPKGHRLMALKV